jgi:hypothetical protein
MLAVSSLQDTWPMLINVSVALLIMQRVDRFNDRAHRPIPWAAEMYTGTSVPQVEQFWGAAIFSS